MKNENQTNKDTNNNAPTFIAYHVTERGEDKYWNRIGAAWQHDDEKGFTVDLELIPVATGRIVLREPKQEDNQQERE